MRAILRVLAALLLALALVLLVVDGTASLAASAFVVTPLAATVTDFFPGALDALKAAIQENVHPLLWEPALTTLLSLPGWAVIGGLGVALALLGRSPSRRRLVSVDSW